MGFKIAMAEVSKEDLQTIRNDRPTGAYDGPTPPPGVYQAKISRLWFAETKAGKPTLKVSFTISEPADSDNATYNGASCIDNYMIPTDPAEKAFPIQVSKIDELMVALSKGKMGYDEFQDAMTAGRSEVDKEDRVGHPVKQIGSVKITGDALVKVKTKIDQYNGKEYLHVDYILRNEKNAKQEASDDLDLSDDVDTEGGDDDLDEWLES